MKINTDTWREFEVTSLFESINRGTRLKQSDRVEGEIPLVTAGFDNYGIAAYVAAENVENTLFDGDTITIDMFGNVFVRSHEFICDDNIIVFQNSQSIEANMFLAGVLRARIKQKFSYADQFRYKSLPGLTVLLPTDSADEPDWQYMQDYIHSLTEPVATRSAVLATTKPGENVLVDSDSWGEFTVGDLFEKPKLGFIADRKFEKKSDVSDKRDEEFSLPLVNAKLGNNGIMYYGRPGEWSSVDLSIDVVQNGASAVGSVYLQDQPTSVLHDAYLITSIDKTVKADSLAFVVAVLQRKIKTKYSYEDKAIWSKVSKDIIKLPQTVTGDPDWTYMAVYISEQRNNVAEYISELLPDVEA